MENTGNMEHFGTDTQRIENTEPKKERIRYDRKYLGITVTASNYRELMELAKADGKDPRHEINYHTRHLEAYLKGNPTFKHGFRYDKDGDVIGPAIFRVMSELKIREK